MGARIEALHPLGPVFHGAGLNITVMSNDGRVGVGVIACRESMPDVDDLAQRFPAELARLQEAVAERPPATPITKNAAKKRRQGLREGRELGGGWPTRPRRGRVDCVRLPLSSRVSR